MKKGFGKLNLFFLILICVGSVLLVLPTINNNINDPNMITYFNADEGFQMDLIWNYYTGEKRGSYYMDVDYGLELLYLSDLARLISPKLIKFNPGTFVLLLRWLHLISWVGTLVALWCLMGSHFGKGWQQILVVLLLAVRPAFNYLSNSLKPEPLVLLFMIIGLNFVLKIVEKPSWRYLLISLLCAAIAFHIKFAGVFLLPVIIAAMHFGESYQTGIDSSYTTIFAKIKHSWILEALTGVCLVTLPFLFIIFYVRKSTGSTFYEKFGLWGSFLNNKVAFLVCFIGIIFIAISLILFFLNKSNSPFLRNPMEKVNRINSCAFIAAGLFSVFLLLLGFRWVFNPVHFIATYSYNLFDFTGLFEIKRISMPILFNNYLHIMVAKFIFFDPLIILLLGFYFVIELYYQFHDLNNSKLQFYKRLTLLIFLIPCFLSIFSIGRFTQHHMLPFFVVACILAVQGANMAYLYLRQKKADKKYIIFAILGAFFILDIILNAAALIKSRIHQFHQPEDVIYDVAKWLRKNVPVDTLIVADSYQRVYIPPEYRNIKIFRYNQMEAVERLRYLVNNYHPQLIYYNVAPCEDESLPPIDLILPYHKIRLVESFDSTGRGYQRRPKEKFVIYRVLY